MRSQEIPGRSESSKARRGVKTEGAGGQVSDRRQLPMYSYVLYERTGSVFACATGVWHQLSWRLRILVQGSWQLALLFLRRKRPSRQQLVRSSHNRPNKPGATWEIFDNNSRPSRLVAACSSACLVELINQHLVGDWLLGFNGCVSRPPANT